MRQDDPIQAPPMFTRSPRLGPTERLRLGWALLRRLWRRSLQFRIVTITLVLSATLVATFSWTVASVITQGLLDAKMESAEQYVRDGGEYAAGQLKVVNQRDDPALRSTVPSVVAQLDQAPALGERVEVVMLGTDPSLSLKPDQVARPDSGAYDVMRSPQLTVLREKVAGHDDVAGRITAQYVTISPDGQRPREYLAFGTPVPTSFGGNLELYYLFPLDSEVEQTNGVRNTLVITGATLVALLALLAALVTRLVVRPVRIAARTAQRLSAGLLDQRMEVHGEDDLARLATAFNHMAANLQRQIIRLEEMSRLQRRFTSDVSHELRTPLTTVRMAADLIFSSRKRFGPAVARSAELLQAELDRFENLLTDLLEISRFDAGFAALDAEPADVVPIIEGVVAQFGSLAKRAGSPIVVDVPDHPVIVEIDPRRVERILRNLVGNAIEHGEGRPVTVTLRADEAAMAVTVRDRGVGLNPGEEELVFNRFWRADPSRARQTGGTGLGLSIGLEDARLHGGWLEAWGARGQGAQFRLTMPVRAGDRLVDSPLPLVPEDVPGSGTAGTAGADAVAAPDVAGDGDAGDRPVGAGIIAADGGQGDLAPVSPDGGSGP